MRVLSLFLLLILSLHSFAEGESSGEQFDERILEDPKFKPIVENCDAWQAQESPTNTYKNYPDCLQKSFKSNQFISSADRKKLKEKYIQTKKMGTNSKKIANYQQLAPETFEKELPRTAEFDALVKYLTQRLEEALYGDDKQKNVVDHNQYYELYKTQISKNVTIAFSQYCLYADSDNKISADPVKKEEQMKKNLEDLKNGPSAYGTWSLCIQAIPEKCKEKDENETEDEKETRVQACIAMSKIRTLKTNLAVTNDIQAKLKNMFKEGNAKGFFLHQHKSKKTIDELTNISSGEVNRNYSKKQKEVLKQLEECKAKLADEDSALDKKCETLLGQYLGKDEDLKKVKKDAEALKIVRGDKSEQDIDEMKKDIVREQTYQTDDQKKISSVENELEGLSEDDIQSIKDEIEKKYDNEQQALIDKIGNQLDVAKKNNKEKVNQIIKDLKADQKHAGALIHYNNIISGYLDVQEDGTNKKKDGKKEKITNVRSIQQELKDYSENLSNLEPSSSGNTSTREPAEATPSWVSKLKESGIMEEKSSNRKNGSATLGNDQLNERLHIDLKTLKKDAGVKD